METKKPGKIHKTAWLLIVHPETTAKLSWNLLLISLRGEERVE